MKKSLKEASLASLGLVFSDICIYNDANSVCGFSVFVGVMAFLACTAFLLSDAYFENIASVQYRRYIVMGDLGFSGTHRLIALLCSARASAFRAR